MRFKGRQAIGLAVSMMPRGDVLQLGRDLEAEMERLRADLPVGIEFAKVSDQPRIVKNAVGLFMRSLLEAVAIVLAVSFLSLGLRAGAVVALTIPLVLAGTFLAMAWFGIDLHRISTGALDDRARAAGGRRDDRGRDDGPQDRGGSRHVRRGHLRLHAARRSRC